MSYTIKLLIDDRIPFNGPVTLFVQDPETSDRFYADVHGPDVTVRKCHPVHVQKNTTLQADNMPDGLIETIVEFVDELPTLTAVANGYSR